MNTKRVFISCGLALALAACAQSPQQTSSDVRREGQKDAHHAPSGVADARSVGRGEEVAGNASLSESEHKIAVARVQDTHRVDFEECNGLQGNQRQQCQDTANATRDQAVAAADVRKSQ